MYRDAVFLAERALHRKRPIIDSGPQETRSLLGREEGVLIPAQFYPAFPFHNFNDKTFSFFLFFLLKLVHLYVCQSLPFSSFSN